MKKTWITFLTIMTVFGLTGLTVVQVIWLKNAIVVKEQRFDNVVQEAMQEIATKVERFEYQPYVKDIIAQNAALLEHFHQTSGYKSWMGRDASGQQKVFIHLENEQDTSVTIEIDIKHQHKKPVLDPLIEYRLNQPHTHKMEMDIERLPISVMVNPDELAQKFMAQRHALNEMVLKQIFSMQPITEVLDTAALEKIIAQTFQRRGIQTHFEFGITEYTKNNFVLVSNGASLAGLYDSKYAVKLFPGNFYDSVKTLVVKFPDRSKFLLQSLWLPLSFSILFLFLVLGSFGLALYIILKQKQLSTMKTEFINNMTHELKTPISTISLASQMLKDAGISTNEGSRMKYASVIYDENKRLGNQVEKVLQMARMEKGEIQYNKNPINLHELIDIALNQFQLQIDDSDGVLERALNAKACIILGDEMHLTNVLNNLLDNSLKYNDKENPAIKISTINEGSNIIIRIKDNGVGIRKEDQKKIFDNFYRVNKGDVHDTKGFGIGLSYVKTIIKAHNGTIDLESVLKQGTEFKITIPLKID